MKNKILVTIIIPILNAQFDFYIPNNRKIGTIKKIIENEYIKKNFSGVNVNNMNFRLIERYSGLEFDNNLYVAESSICNGDILVMI